MRASMGVKRNTRSSREERIRTKEAIGQNKGSPAHAGMDRGISGGSPENTRLPRQRGDEPNHGVV